MTLAEAVKQNSQGLIARAYAFAEKAHKGQKRKSGEPYFVHPTSTGETLLKWRLDEATVAAGVLHDTMEDTGIAPEHLKKEFGEEVLFLVDGVTKLGKIKYRGVAAHVENMQKLIFALTKDIRIIFVKLADRLHNMQTLDALPPAKQKRIALETDEIYAPLAYRLGMQNVWGELRDLAFHYLHPKEEAWIKENVSGQYEERFLYLKKIRPELKKILAAQNIRPKAVDFRAKRYSSLHHKLLRHNMDLERIYDLVAMRLIVDTTEQCYAALGAVHAAWPPLPGRIKDYIALPKPNGYRSLHTTVIGPERRVVEIQIRTAEMHEENENGVPAHWFYLQEKEGKKETFHALRNRERELAWLKQLKEWQEKYLAEKKDPEEYLQAMKVDFFKDRIFVITPKGDVLDLPAGATPVDFAYEIHGELGDSCVAAKVNDRFVPLSSELHSGDLVEILRQKNKKPSEDWLAFVKTSKARDRIKTAVREKKRMLFPGNGRKKRT